MEARAGSISGTGKLLPKVGKKLVEDIRESKPFNGVQDIIVVRQEDGTFKSTGWYLNQSKRFFGGRQLGRVRVKLAINGSEISDFNVTLDHFTKDEDGVPVFFPSPDVFIRLIAPNLGNGGNDILFYIENLRRLAIPARIFLWNRHPKLFIVDVDGTLTRSDKRGLICCCTGEDWIFPKVADWLSLVKREGYEVLYLTARPSAMTNSIRKYFKDNAKLPDGPLLAKCHGRIHAVFDYVLTSPAAFKTSCLKQIREKYPGNQNPFHAALGNRKSDRKSFRNVGIPYDRIFHVNKTGGHIATDEGGATISSFRSYEDSVNYLNLFSPQRGTQQADSDSDDVGFISPVHPGGGDR